MQVKFKKIDPRAIIPSYAHSTDAGLDLTAIEILLDNNESLWIDTGLSVEIPEGFVGLIFPRSSITTTDLILGNCVGVIDSSYRGSIQFRFRYINKPNFEFDEDWVSSKYKIGERIGQLIIMPYPKIEVVEVDELLDSDRGMNGYGSTGK